MTTTQRVAATIYVGPHGGFSIGGYLRGSIDVDDSGPVLVLDDGRRLRPADRVTDWDDNERVKREVLAAHLVIEPETTDDLTSIPDLLADDSSDARKAWDAESERLIGRADVARHELTIDDDDWQIADVAGNQIRLSQDVRGHLLADTGNGPQAAGESMDLDMLTRSARPHPAIPGATHYVRVGRAVIGLSGQNAARYDELFERCQQEAIRIEGGY